MKNKLEYIEKLINSKKIYGALLAFYIVMYVLLELCLEPYKLYVIRGIKLSIILIVLGGLNILYNSIFYKKENDNNDFKLICLVFALGILLRILRIYSFPWDMFQHDVNGEFGHMDYIRYIANNNALPAVNTRQFYHPPLHHTIAALWLKINLFFKIDEGKAIEGIQYLTAFYSTVTMIVSYKIFKIIGFKDKILLLSTSLIATAPTFIILASSLNNDILMIMFMFICIFYCIKWYQEPTINNIIILALSLGFGMMAKVNSVLVAVTIAILFLIKLIKSGEFFNIDLWKQYLTFGFISIPLGMWHPIRNLIKCNQPFGYVLRFSEKSNLYVGNYSIKERFLSFDFINNVINNSKCRPIDEYNILTYTIKSSMLNEYLPNYKGDLIKLLLILNTIMIIFSLIAMIYVIVSVREQWIISVVMGTVWVVQVLSFIYFNIQYPFGCTMDFRYIVPTLLTGITFICMAVDNIIKNRYELWKKINFIFSFVSLGFILTSIVVYTL